LYEVEGYDVSSFKIVCTNANVRVEVQGCFGRL